MSAQDSLSKELFFEAYRGIPKSKTNNFKINENNLGVHWSANPVTAHIFGNVGTKFGQSVPHLLTQQGGVAQVYTAHIPVSSVETNTDTLHANKVWVGESQEKEIPVKKGASVLVTKRTSYRKTKEKIESWKGSKAVVVKPRTRTYNPPREMQA